MKRFLQFTLLLCSLMFTTTEVGAWEFTLISPAEGKVESLSNIQIKAPFQVGGWDDYWYINFELKKDGSQETTYILSKDFDLQTFSGTNIKYTTYTDNGVYKLIIPENTVVEGGQGNEYQEFIWTIGDGGGDQGGGDSTPESWDITITPNEIYVTETPTSITINIPDGKTIQEVNNSPSHATFNNENVTLGRDGNTVTISLDTSITEAGEYTLRVPAGAIVATDGSINNEFEHTWVIKGETPIVGTWTFSSVSPATGTVTSLKDFKFYGGNITGSKGFTLVEQSTGNNYSFDVSYNSQEGCLEGSLSQEKTTPGTYTIHLEEGFMQNANYEYNREMTYTWTIEEPATPEGSGWEFTSISLPQGEVTEIPKEIILSHNFGYLYEFEPISGTLNTPIGNEPERIKFTFDAPYIITININSIYTAPGNYSITIPANTFHKSVNWELGEGNKEVTFTWTIKAQPWEFDSDSVEPSIQKDVESLQNFTFTMPRGKELVANSSYSATITGPNNIEKQLYLSGSGYTITGVLDEELTTPGEYTLTIPEDVLTSTDRTVNKEMTYTWTVRERWSFTGSEPADGEDNIEKIYGLTFYVPNTIGNVDEFKNEPIFLCDNIGNPVAKYNGFQSFSEGDKTYIIANAQDPTTQGFMTNGITNSGKYTLTIPQGYCKVNGIGNNEQTFTWTIPERAVTLGAVNKKGQYWATFSSDKAVRFDEDVTVYTVSANGATLNMNEITSREVPANTGVLIKCEDSGSSYAVISTAANVGDNLLKPSSKNMGDQDLNNHKFYRLAYKNFNTKTGLGFYYGAGKENGEKFVCKAGTAYLAVPNSAGARSFYMFDEDDETTGVNNVNENVNENHDVYNLAGQRVNANHKGIVIVNGKKVVK